MGTDATTTSTLRATAHPLRLRILSLLTGDAMSAAEVARELEVTHANASYHLRVLAEAGLLVEAGEEKIRGGVAKRYRHPWEDVRLEGGSGPEGAADALTYVRAMAAELVRRYQQRRRGVPGLLTDAELWVAPDTWQRARDLVEQASRLVHAEARAPRSPGSVHVNLTAAAFEMADPEGSR